jgi:hypothetical protein
MERLAREKHTSLFGPFRGYEENEVFVNMTSSYYFYYFIGGTMSCHILLAEWMGCQCSLHLGWGLFILAVAYPVGLTRKD